MSIAPYLKVIGRGREGARALTLDQGKDLFEQVLDGGISDLERGAFCIAMRIKGESCDELQAFVQVAQARCTPLAFDRPCVVLASYNGARKRPNLTPLLAGLLAQRGLAVMVHGLTDDPGRTTSMAIAQAMDHPILHQADGLQDDLEAEWSKERPAFVHLSAWCPSLVTLLNVRRVIGLRNPGHTIVKLLTPKHAPRAIAVMSHTHPEYAQSHREYIGASLGHALLLRGTEGEPYADPRRTPSLSVFRHGMSMNEAQVDGQTGSLATLPDLPEGIDAEPTASWIRWCLAGVKAVPAPLLQQVEALLTLAKAL